MIPLLLYLGVKAPCYWGVFETARRMFARRTAHPTTALLAAAVRMGFGLTVGFGVATLTLSQEGWGGPVLFNAFRFFLWILILSMFYRGALSRMGLLLAGLATLLNVGLDHCFLGRIAAAFRGC